MLIKKRDLEWYISFCFLVVLSLYRSNAVFGQFNLILNIIDVIAFVWAVGLFLRYKMYNIRVLWIVVLMPIWFSITTIFNSADVKECVMMSYKMIATVYITYFLIKQNRNKAIIAIAKYWSLFMIIQAFSYVTKCFGINAVFVEEYNYFFGLRVNIDQYIIYALFFNFLAAYIGKKKEKLSLIVCCICSVYFIVAEWVSTSILGTTVFFAIIVGSLLIKTEKLWRYIAGIVLVFSVQFYFMQNISMFSVVVVDFLKKDMSFSGRTELWAWVLNNIHGIHWIVGYGDIEQMTIPRWFSYTTHPHSNYLEMLYKYGAIGLSMYLIMFGKIIKRVKKIAADRVRIYVLASLIATLLMCIVSKNYWFMTAQIYYVIIMCGCDFDNLKSSEEYI